MARCWSPIRIRCDPAKWNNWHDYSYVPCGKCPACRARKRAEWVVRNEIELKHSKNAFFITLTYANQWLPIGANGLPTLKKRDLQLFLKRFRKILGDDHIRYFACGEYGTDTKRPHYHLIVYNFPEEKFDIDDVVRRSWHYHQDDKSIRVERIKSMAAIAYTAKYVLKSDDFNDRDQKPFMLASRRPAIGSQELKSRVAFEKVAPQVSWVRPDGYKAPVPRYFRSKYKELMSEMDYEHYDDIRRAEMSEIERKQLAKERVLHDKDIRRYGKDMHLPDYEALLHDFQVVKSKGKL